MFWCLKNTYKLEDSLIQQIKVFNLVVFHNYDSLIDGLRDLNQKNNTDHILFIYSEKTKSSFLCIRCKNKEFDHYREHTINILTYNLAKLKKN